MERQRRTIIITALITAALLLVGWGAYQILVVSKRGTIVTDASPDDLLLTLDGKKIASIGKRTVDPGSHKLVASRSGFETMNIDFDIKKKEVKLFDLYLTANSAEGLEWLKNHPQQAVKKESKSGAEFNKSTEEAVEDNGLIQQLPFIAPGFEFRVDYGGPQEGNKFPGPTIIIQAEGDAAKQDALTWIRNQGFDPDKMNITYTNKPPQ